MGNWPGVCGDERDIFAVMRSTCHAYDDNVRLSGCVIAESEAAFDVQGKIDNFVDQPVTCLAGKALSGWRLLVGPDDIITSATSSTSI